MTTKLSKNSIKVDFSLIKSKKFVFGGLFFLFICFGGYAAYKRYTKSRDVDNNDGIDARVYDNQNENHDRAEKNRIFKEQIDTFLQLFWQSNDKYKKNNAFSELMKFFVMSYKVDGENINFNGKSLILPFFEIYQKFLQTIQGDEIIPKDFFEEDENKKDNLLGHWLLSLNKKYDFNQNGKNLNEIMIEHFDLYFFIPFIQFSYIKKSLDYLEIVASKKQGENIYEAMASIQAMGKVLTDKINLFKTEFESFSNSYNRNNLVHERFDLFYTFLFEKLWQKKNKNYIVTQDEIESVWNGQLTKDLFSSVKEIKKQLDYKECFICYNNQGDDNNPLSFQAHENNFICQGCYNNIVGVDNNRCPLCRGTMEINQENNKIFCLQN